MTENHHARTDIAVIAARVEAQANLMATHQKVNDEKFAALWAVMNSFSKRFYGLMLGIVGALVAILGNLYWPAG